MLRVIHNFQDKHSKKIYIANKSIYKEEISEERLKELTTSKNDIGCPLVEIVPNEQLEFKETMDNSEDVQDEETTSAKSEEEISSNNAPDEETMDNSEDVQDEETTSAKSEEEISSNNAPDEETMDNSEDVQDEETTSIESEEEISSEDDTKKNKRKK